jgi:hypothetical protein
MDALLESRQRGAEIPDLGFVFDGFLCSKPDQSALITATLITACVGILSLLSPRHRHSNLSLIAGAFWAAFYLSFLIAAFYEACWFTAIISWAIHAANPFRSGSDLGTAQTLLHAAIFGIMLVGTLMMVAFWLMAVVVTLLKLASIFRRDRVYTKRKSVLQ